jgi:hypothetical protein
VFDLSSEAVEDLRGLLQQWTAAAVSLTAGQPYQSAAQEWFRSTRPLKSPRQWQQLRHPGRKRHVTTPVSRDAVAP